MTKLNRIICVTLAVLLVFSFSSFVVFANDGGAGGEVAGGEAEIPEGDGGEIPVDEPEPQTPETPDVPEEDNTPAEDNNYSVEDDNDDYYNYVEDNYQEDVNSQNYAADPQPQAELFDAREISSAEMAANKWSNIEIPQQDNSKNNVDFTTIQKDTSAADNGQWILWTGFILMGASLLGIMYFIISTVTYRKKLNNLNRRQKRNNETRTRSSHDNRYEDAPREAYNQRQRISSPARNNRRYATDTKLSYADKKRLKADTAEIYIPKRLAK